MHRLSNILKAFNDQEHDKALQRVMTAMLKDDTELFKQFMDNGGFRRWLTDTVFGLTYEGAGV